LVLDILITHRMSQMPDINELLKRWPSLPDEAVVHAKVAAAVTGLSERTIRYDERFKRVYLTEKSIRHSRR
jgi:hypothetical protein